MKQSVGFLLLFLFFNSCGIGKMAKGEKDDYNKARARNKEYLVGVLFEGVIENKYIQKVQGADGYQLKINLIKIDSIPNLVNREYGHYFSFDNEKTLRVAVNQAIYDQAIINDTIIKDKMQHTLFFKNNSKSLTLKWLDEGNEWLVK